MADQKTCTICQKTLSADQENFHLSGGVFHTQCKNCRNSSLRERYATSEARHASYRRASQAYTNRLRIETLTIYSNGVPECQCCAEKQLEFLTLDHINNDGHLHRKDIGSGGSKLYRWAKKNGYPPVLQVLCYNCNMAKAKYGYCPHQQGSVATKPT